MAPRRRLGSKKAHGTSRVSPTSTDATANVPKKRGNKGDFHGARLAYLESQLDAFDVARQKRGYSDVWDNLFVGYWLRFPWFLPLTEDPPPAGAPDDDISNLSADELVQRAQIISATEKKIKRWFCYRRYKKRSHRNVWAQILRRHNQTVTGKAPKMLAPWQIYFSKRSADISQEVSRTHPNITSRESFQERAALARSWYEQEEDSVKAECQAEAEREHEEEMEAWELDQLHVVPDDASQEAARENVAEALLPLVELIAEQTGTCISVFVGRPPSKNADTRKFFLRAVHCGTAGPKQLEWSDFDPDGFRVATSKFSSFVSKANIPDVSASSQTTPNRDITPLDSPSSTAPLDQVETPPTHISHASEPSPNPPSDRPLSHNNISTNLLRTSNAPTTSTIPAQLLSDTSGPSVEPPSPNVHPSPLQSPPPTPAASTTPPTIETLLIGPELRDELRALSSEDMLREVATLASLSPLELQRESNLARNRVLMRIAGIENDSMQNLMRRTGKSAHGSRNKSHSKAGPSNRRDGDVERSDESDEEDGEESGEDNGHSTEEDADSDRADEGTSTNRGLSGKGKASTRGRVSKRCAEDGVNSSPTAFVALSPATILTPPAVQQDSWPEWLASAYQHLSHLTLGSDFLLAVQWWTKVERDYSFESSTRGLPTFSRPPQVGFWIQYLRRELEKTPDIKDTDAYGEQWWTWWAHMQPEWREHDNTRFSRDSVGDWTSLTRPGKNGLLIVLMSLAWWAQALGDHNTDPSWCCAVNDVAWTLTQLGSITRNKKRGRANDEPSTSKRPQKRRK